MRGPEQRVTALELFFDLAFVFTITQVTDGISDHLTTTGLIEELAVLAMLWWAWVAYSWLGNTAGSDEGAVRVVLLVATVPLLITSLAVPRAFGRDALVFGVAFLAVRCLHLAGYLVLAREDPVLQRVVRRLARTILPAAGLLALAGALGGSARAACWAGAITLDYAGLAVSGTQGWTVNVEHFAERYGLVVIIALGESIVSLGVGARGLRLTAPVLAAAALGIAIAGALWWAYFDVVALAGLQRLRNATPDLQARIARDSYTYLHLPMLAGIIIFAVGIKQTLHAPDAFLHGLPAGTLCGGLALYLLALSAFKKRNYGTYNRPRLFTATLLLALIPAALRIDALLAEAAVAVLVCALIAYEALSYAAARQHFRRG